MNGDKLDEPYLTEKTDDFDKVEGPRRHALRDGRQPRELAGLPVRRSGSCHDSDQAIGFIPIDAVVGKAVLHRLAADRHGRRLRTLAIRSSRAGPTGRSPGTNSRANDHTIAAIPNAASQTISGGGSSAKNVRVAGDQACASTNSAAIAQISASRARVSGAATIESTRNPIHVSIITAAVCACSERDARLARGPARRRGTSRSRPACPRGSRTAAPGARTRAGTARVFGASARKNDGMPIVSAPISVRCRGRNGNTNPTTPIASEMQHRVDGLREVQRRSCARCCRARGGPRRPPAAARRTSSPAARAARPRGWRRCPSPSPRRCRRPSARGRRSRRRRSSPPCARAPAARCTIARFCCGRDAAEDARASRARRASSSSSSAASRASTGSSAPSRPERRGDRARPSRGCRRESTFTVTPCSAKYRSVVGGVGPKRSASTTTAAGSRSAGSRRRRARPRARAATTRCPPPASPRPPRARRAARRAGAARRARPRTHAPCPVERRAAPLPRADENGDRVGDAPVRRGVRIALADRAHRGVRRRVGGRERGEDAAAASRPSAERLHPLDRQPPLGERAGLVDAQHVDAREPLDGRQLLDEHAPPRQAHHGDRERERREQDEPLGHHRDRAGDGARHRLAPVVVRAQLAPEQQAAVGTIAHVT